MLYKYASANEYDLRNICDAVLYLNTPISFNDPFDMSADFEIDEEGKKIAVNLCQEENKGQYLGNLEKLTTEDLEKIYRLTDRKTVYNKKYGITCFSRTSDNILMWSHYANKHKGLCLGYSLVDDVDLKSNFLDMKKLSKLGIFNCEILPVEYIDKTDRPIWSLPVEDERVKKLLKTKYELWKYEQEVRLLIVTKDERVFPCPVYYERKYLKEITFGAMMELGEFVKIYSSFREDIEEWNIDIYAMTLNLRSYELEKHLIPSDTWEIIYNNFKYLQHPKWILHYNDIKEIKLRCGERKLYTYWKKALKAIPVSLVFSDLDCLLEADLANVLSNPINIQESTKMVTYQCFIDWMYDEMCALENKEKGK